MMVCPDAPPPPFLPPAALLQVRLTLAGKPPLPTECIMHPGRTGCKVEKLLAA